MPDEVTARDTGSTFTAHDEGQFAAVCVDTIDLGSRVEQYPGQPARIMDKCALVFVTDTEGETKEIAREFSVSMGEKANLRAFLEAWRGKSYTDDQAKAGVPLHKLVGHGALLSVEHKTSGKGRTYSNIKAVAPLPKQMHAPSAAKYERPEYWAKRVEQYAAEAMAWAEAQNKVAGGSANAEDFPDPVTDDDSDLPF